MSDTEWQMLFDLLRKVSNMEGKTYLEKKELLQVAASEFDGVTQLDEVLSWFIE